MKILPCTQGSAEWNAARAKCFTASEAPAMMGVSKYMTRNELLRQKATGIQAEVDDATQARFNRGHAAEAAARPLVERMIDDDLYPTVATNDDGDLLASFDGITMDNVVGFEHKLWNEELAAAVRSGELGPEYFWQLEQQILVGGMEKIVFVCSDGTPDNFVHMEYRAVPGRAEQLLAGWKQFAEDLANYTPAEVLPPVVAAPVLNLPAVSVKVAGQLMVTSNFDAFEIALRDFIDHRLIRNPKTDQDFADLDTQIKTLKKAEEALIAAEDAAVAQVAAIESMKRTKEMLYKVTRDNRLMAEKLLEAEKTNRRTSIVEGGRQAFETHVSALNKRLGKPYMPAIQADFAGAIKNKRTIASLQDAVDTLLAQKKIEANEIADRIEINLNYLRENAKEYPFLFSDAAQIVLKANDDFEALAKLRIAEHKAEEERKLEAERARIRAEEESKARAEAEAKLKAEQEEAARLQRDEAKARADAPAQSVSDYIDKTKAGIDVLAPTETVSQIGAGSGDSPAAPTLATVPHSAAPAAVANAIAHPDDGRRMKLGDINARLYPLSVSADGLATLGFEHVDTEKNAKLYREQDFPAICAAIVRHVQTAAIQPMRKAA